MKLLDRLRQRPVLARRLLTASACLGLTAALTASAVPGVFNLDENSYLVSVVGLRNGSFALDNTAGLEPSSALYWFDPTLTGRAAHPAPARSNSPPLYAFFALPFSFAGFRGLIALNALSFAIACALVLALARLASYPRTVQWLCVGAFALGGFALEYAFGAWPHMLAVALACGAALAIVRSTGAQAPRQALLWGGLGGFLAACAAGIRYQNAVFLILLGLAALLWGRSRWAGAAGVGLGALGPVALSSWINHARVGSWNPFSKGPGYVSLGATSLEGTDNRVLDALLAFWTKVVDFSLHPAIMFGPIAWEPDKMGGFIHGAAVKRAWLQASPILALALVGIAIAWSSRSTSTAHRMVRLFSWLVGGMLLLFAAAGTGRHDGLSFNPRYFLELAPLAAVCAGLALERVRLKWRPLLIGAGAGLGVALAGVLARLETPLRSLLILQPPLVLAVLTVAAWVFWRRGKVGEGAVAGLTAACLAWALTVHLGTDVRQSRAMRRWSHEQSLMVAGLLPERSTYLGAAHIRDAIGPLILDRDLVILEPDHDVHGAIKAALTLHRQGRSIFVDHAELPAADLEAIRQAFQLRVRVPGPDPISEAWPSIR